MAKGDGFVSVLSAFSGGDDVFDAVPDTVYFLKDAGGRYRAVNQTLVERTGASSRSALIGKTADEVFPGELGRRIAEQDSRIMAGGQQLVGELELHLYPGGEEGWCLTWKSPLREATGTIAGLFGMSRDVRPVGEESGETLAFSSALRHLSSHLDQPMRLGDLAKIAGLSVFQFDQRIRQLFGMSAGQYVTRLKMDHARHLLARTDRPIAEIALDCGYGDQTAFTRQFRKITRLTPMKYRARGRGVS